MHVVVFFSEKSTSNSLNSTPRTTISPKHGIRRIAGFQNTHIEELKLPEIMIPVSTNETKKGKLR